MKKIMLMVLLSFLFVSVNTTFAITYTPNVRPTTIVNSGELALQSIIDSNVTDTSGNSVIDVNNDQNAAGAWSIEDDGSKTYGVAFFAGNSGTLGLYSLGLESGFTLLTRAEAEAGYHTELSFDVNTGDMYANKYSGFTYLSQTYVENFGNSFAFYWADGADLSVSYTMDTLNDDPTIPMALSYLVPDGSTLTGDLRTVSGLSGATEDNDWIIAFNDNASGHDGDFNDAVFYMTDLTPVPEPATLLLLGSGLVGLAFLKRRKA